MRGNNLFDKYLMQLKKNSGWKSYTFIRIAQPLMTEMIFESHTLNEPLKGFIETIFHFKGLMPKHSIERVVPTAHIHLIFELDGQERKTFDNDSLEPNARFTKAWISGMQKGHITISSHQNSEMFVIQFKSHGSYPFLHQPVHELNDRIVPADEILGTSVLNLRQSLLAVEESSEKFHIAEKWLEDKLEQTKTPPDELVSILNKLRKEPAIKYNKIIEEYSATQKHLIEQFKNYVGLKPKEYQRILRFNDILVRIQEKDQITWTDIAYSCGYSDQSHFIKEFKHFSGFNPREFIKEDFHRDEGNFFPLDRKG